MKRSVSALLLLFLFCFSGSALAATKKEIWTFQGKVAFYQQDEAIGLLHDDGKRTLVAPVFQEVRPFINGLANVCSEGLWGVINTRGRWIFRAVSLVPVDFGPQGEHGRFSPEEGMWGFINRNGEVVIEPAPYEEVGVMSKGLFTAKQNGLYGYVDWNGKVAIDFQFQQAHPFSEGLASVEKGGKWGFITPAGETALPFDYAEAGSFVGDLAPVKLSQEEGVAYIDPKGKVRFQGAWEWGGDFTASKLARVRLNENYGYINKSGRLVIAARYAQAYDFSNDYAAVKLAEGRWVYINPKGKIISKEYLIAEPYENGFAFVTFKDPDNQKITSGYINASRRFVSKTLEKQ